MPGPKAKSTTALFAAVAMRLRGVTTADRPGYLKNDLGVDLSPATVGNAARESERMRGEQVTVFRQADAVGLEFFSALVRLEVETRRSNALTAVRAIPGVTQVLRLQRLGDLVAIVIYETPTAMRTIEGRLAEHGEIKEWSQLDLHDYTPAIGTWEKLAREAAAIEDLRA